MFLSATLRLTAAYLAILMAISLLFSVVIYQISVNEVSTRLQNLELGIREFDLDYLTGPTLDSNGVRILQARQASDQIILWLFYINVIIFIAGGTGSYFLARRTLEPIELALEAQKRFTSDVSHELRTPLAAMKTELEVALRDRNLTIAEARELLESSLEEANKLIMMSEVFLKLARLDYDSVNKEPINIVDTLTDALKQFKPHQKRFELHTRKESYVVANEPAISELMALLIDNAIKYSTPDTPIIIGIYEKRLNSYFSVTNKGVTIPKEKQQHMFDRFYRGDYSRTASAQNGYGLGLAIAKRISNIHKGDLRVKSHQGQTAFIFSMPTTRAPQEDVMSETTE